MGQAAGDLAEQAQAFGLANRLLKLGEPFGHLVDRLAQIAQLVIARGQWHRTEIAGRDQARAAFPALENGV